MSCVVFGGSLHGAEQLRHVSLRCVSDDGVLGPDSGVKKKTIKVKFLLQKKCMFGEHFKVTGAHSSLGCWNPEAAIPLEWSDGHNWTAELEVPQGEEYEYKFVLKYKNGGIEWQPGPNRVFSTSKSSSLLISQTWEINESQPEILIEEEDDGSAADVPKASVEVEKDQELSVSDNRQHHNVAEVPEASVGVEKDQEASVSDNRQDHSVEEEDDGSAVAEVPEASVGVEKDQEPSVSDNGEHLNDYEQFLVDEPPEVIEAPEALQDAENGTLTTEDVEDIEQDSTVSKFEEKTIEVVDVEADVQPTGLTLWKKDRAWFVKAIMAISSFFKR